MKSKFTAGPNKASVIEANNRQINPVRPIRATFGFYQSQPRVKETIWAFLTKAVEYGGGQSGLPISSCAIMRIAEFQSCGLGFFPGFAHVEPSCSSYETSMPQKARPGGR